MSRHFKCTQALTSSKCHLRTCLHWQMVLQTHYEQNWTYRAAVAYIVLNNPIYTLGYEVF